MVHLLAKGQGIYFLITGLWPLIHMESFLAITGPKEDLWLVETVGVLVIAIGVALLFARPDPFPIPIVLMAIVSTSGLAAIEVIYVTREVILPVYLADAAIQVIIVIAWIIAWIRHKAA